MQPIPVFSGMNYGVVLSLWTDAGSKQAKLIRASVSALSLCELHLEVPVCQLMINAYREAKKWWT